MNPLDKKKQLIEQFQLRKQSGGDKPLIKVDSLILDIHPSTFEWFRKYD